MLNLGREDETKEFKESISQLDEGIKSLTAMLNRHHRGTVYLGVNDDGDVIGMDIGNSTLQKIRNRIRDLAKPHVVCEIEVHEDENRRYVSITAAGSDVPYSYDGRYFIRNVASNESAEPHVLKKIIAGNNDILSSIPAPIQELTFSGMSRVLESRSVTVPSMKSLYSSYNLMNDTGKFNLMAYLLSDQCGFAVKAVLFDGTDKLSMKERRDYSGQSLLVTVESVLEYLKVFNTVAVDMSEGVRKEVELFSYDAFREAWINACLHNDWVDRVPPSVYIFDDRIEVTSYGGLPYDLSLEDFYTGSSRPVNTGLMSVFMSAKFVEQSGHGVPTIVDRCGREAYTIGSGMITVTIRFNFEPGYVTLRKNKLKTLSKLNDNQAAVYQYLKEHPSSKLEEVAEECGITLAGVKKITLKLREEGLLRREGGKKNGVWIVS